MKSGRVLLPLASLLSLATWALPGATGQFDPLGTFSFPPDAVATEGFEGFPVYEADAGPGDADAGPQPIEGIEPVEASDALEGNWFARVRGQNRWDYVHVPLALPVARGAYRARMWMRSGNAAAVFTATYATRPEGRVLAELSPTGRCTSDGWVELETAAVSIDGDDVGRMTIGVQGQVDVDAYELVAAGDYVELPSCSGVRDPSCGPDALCISGSCRQGAALVPALPKPQDRSRVVDLFETRLRFFFGGKVTRSKFLPEALEELTQMRTASTAWEFWNHFTTAIRKLHDWHTSARGLVSMLDRKAHLNLCFIEGRADRSQETWPSHPRYLDLLVSHTGPDHNLGLHPGDRLVAVDGIHPIEWVRSLIDVSWDWWQADDDEVNAEIAEILRGLIPVYARTLTVIRCDPAALTCSDVPEVVEVSSLAPDEAGQADSVQCDNRPAYHLVDGPDPATHDVGYSIFKGLLKDSAPGEDLYGMTWDTLWGPTYTPVFESANADFKANARGVILDHRAGNGGTIDAPSAITELVRDRFPIAIFPFGRPSAGYEGPETLEDGLKVYERYKTTDYLTYTVGSAQADELLPVALLIHRDGSASDYLPYGMKGAPKVRIFGPQATAGAFSSFTQFVFWGQLTMVLAEGDTITFEGDTLIGKGVEPDEIVLPLQSDLLQGRDTIYERALAWVRSEAKP